MDSLDVGVQDDRLDKLPVSGRERCPGCHPERSEGSLRQASEILRCAQDDRLYLQMSARAIWGTGLTLIRPKRTLSIKHNITYH